MFDRDFDMIFASKVRGVFSTSFDFRGNGYHHVAQPGDHAIISPNVLSFSLNDQILFALAAKGLPSPILQNIMSFHHEMCFNKILLQLRSKLLVNKGTINCNTPITFERFVKYLEQNTRCHTIIANGYEIRTIVPIGRIRMDVVVSLIVENENIRFNQESFLVDRYKVRSSWVHGHGKFQHECEYLRDMETLMHYFEHNGTLSRPLRPAKANLNRTRYETLMICCKKRYEHWGLGKFYWKIDPIRLPKVNRIIEELEMDRQYTQCRSRLVIPVATPASFVRVIREDTLVVDEKQTKIIRKRAEEKERDLMGMEDEDVNFDKWEEIVKENEAARYESFSFNLPKLERDILATHNEEIDTFLRRNRRCNEKTKAEWEAKRGNLELAIKELMTEEEKAEYLQCKKFQEDMELIRNPRPLLTERQIMINREADRLAITKAERARGVPMEERTYFDFQTKEKYRAIKAKYNHFLRIKGDRDYKRVKNFVKDEEGRCSFQRMLPKNAWPKLPTKVTRKQPILDTQEVYTTATTFSYNKDLLTAKQIGLKKAEEWQQCADLRMREIIATASKVERYEKKHETKYRPGRHIKPLVGKYDVEKYSNRMKRHIYAAATTIPSPPDSFFESIMTDTNPYYDESQNYTLRILFHSLTKLGVVKQYGLLSHDDMLLAVTRSMYSNTTQRVKNPFSLNHSGTRRANRRFAKLAISQVIEQTVSYSID